MYAMRKRSSIGEASDGRHTVYIIAPIVGAIIGGSINRARAGQGADKAPE
jgi:glycerol uptake facilitator-like aquaporin